MEDVQFIETPAGRMAVMTEADYRRLVEAAEDVHDGELVRQHQREKAAGSAETIPNAFVSRIMDGENAVKVFRDWRGLTAAQLAEKAGLSRAYITQIETGKRDGSVTALRAIATALGLTLEELAP